MIIIGAKDIGPTKYINEYTKNLKDIFWIETKKNLNLFKKKIKFNQIKKLKVKPNFIITGTCIGPGIDKKLLIYAKKQKIISISMIEHWSFLKERFLLNKKLILPDYIFVTDIYSKNFLLKNLDISKKRINIIGNNYLKSLNFDKKKNFSNLNNKRKIISFISQPHKSLEKKLFKYLGIRDYFGFDEFDTIKILKSYINKNKDYEIKIKLHPNEKRDKFNSIVNKRISLYKKNVHKEEIISISEYIIGMDSILLLELYLMGGNVISLRAGKKTKFYGDKFKLFPIFENINDLSRYLNSKKKFKRKILNIKTNKILPILKKLK